MDVSDFYSFSFAGSEKPGFEISNGENEQLAKAKCEKKVMFAPGKDSVDFGGMRNSHFLYTPIRMVGEGAYGYVMLSSVRYKIWFCFSKNIASSITQIWVHQYIHFNAEMRVLPGQGEPG